MKILTSTILPVRTMTVSRAKAISSIEDNLQLVADRLAKIFCHTPWLRR
jgi:hypothetical protein